MKKKLLKYIGYLFCILLTFSSCVNEMDVIENEQDLKTNNERLYPSDNWVKYLINYEGSTLDEYDLYKIENMLKNIYDHMPQMQDVINTLIMKGLKF